MLPQPTVYAKILYLLMMLIAGALCNTDRVYLYSKCSERFVGMTPDGKVLANDNSGSGRQTITISNPPDFFEGPLKLALFIEEAQMYVCFTKRWRIVTSKTLHDLCYFYETLENGWFQFRSAVDQTKKLGFNKKGKPITNRQSNHQCINFQKKKVAKRTFKSRPAQRRTPLTTTTTTTIEPMPTTTPTTTVPPHIRHKHHGDVLKHQLKHEQHQQELLAEERLKYEQSHIPQPHSHHHDGNVPVDASATDIVERPRPVRPLGGGGRKRMNKHRAKAANAETTGSRQTPEQMANDEPLRPEDLPNMLDYPPNEEYTKFRARPAYYSKQPEPHSLVPARTAQLVPTDVQPPPPPRPIAPRQSPLNDATNNSHSPQYHTKGQLPKYRNAKRQQQHPGGKKSYDSHVAANSSSSTNLNSNS